MVETNGHSEKITDMLTNRVGQGIKQFLGTTGISYISRFFNTPWVSFFAAPAFLLVDHFIHERLVRGRYRALITNFGSEISALSGVPIHELTIERTQEILDANRDNPRFIVIEEGLKINDDYDRQKTILSYTAAIVTTLCVFGLTSFGINPLAVSFVVGTASTLLTGIASDIITINTQEKTGKSVEVVVREITQQAVSQEVQPAKLLQAFLQAQPNLQQKVAHRFGKAYSAMTFGEKNQVVAFLDEPLKLTEITGKINAGIMRPTEVAWIVYNQRSGVPEKIPALKTVHTDQEKAPAGLSFVSRLQQQECSATALGQTIH